MRRRLPAFKPIPVDSFQELVRKLDMGDIDFAIIDEPLALPLLRPENGFAFKNAAHLRRYLADYYEREIGESKEEYAIATNDPQLKDKLDEILGSQYIQCSQLPDLARKYCPLDRAVIVNGDTCVQRPDIPEGERTVIYRSGETSSRRVHGAWLN